ncbi:MAG: hypothetical protein ABIP71_11040 [Verrucomicrobiota bacterium]
MRTMQEKFRNSSGLVTRYAFVFLAILWLASSGCSTFNRDWKKTTEVSNLNGIEGRWQGTWTSDANGHSGGLRCILEKVSETIYRARFDSTYKKVLHFKSTVILNGTNNLANVRFNGEAKLPWWAGGLYRYEGSASATNFFSTYNCRYDHGTFQMIRPD